MRLSYVAGIGVGICLLLMFQNCSTHRGGTRTLATLPEPCLNQQTTSQLRMVVGEAISPDGRLVAVAHKALIQTELGPLELRFQDQPPPNLDQSWVYISRESENSAPRVDIVESTGRVSLSPQYFVKSLETKSKLDLRNIEDCSTGTTSSSSSTSTTTSSSTSSTLQFPTVTQEFQSIISTIPSGDNQKTLVVRLKGMASDVSPYTDTDIRKVVWGENLPGSLPSSIASFYDVHTDGYLQVTGDKVIGPYNVSSACPGDFFQMLNEVRPSFENQVSSTELLSLKHIVFLIPNSTSSACSFSGLGSPEFTVPFHNLNHRLGISWTVESANQNTFAGLLSHEFGHSLGLNHSDAISFFRRPQDINWGQSTWFSYLDPFDVMGGNFLNSSLHAVHLENLGVLDSRNLVVAESGVHQIFNIERNMSSALKLHLKTPMKMSTGVFNLRSFWSIEHRNIESIGGPVVLIRMSNLKGQTLILRNGLNFEFSLLRLAGDTFTDKINGLLYRLVSIDENSARISIETTLGANPFLELRRMRPLGVEGGPCRQVDLQVRTSLRPAELRFAGIEERPFPYGRYLSSCMLNRIGESTDLGCIMESSFAPPFRDVYVGFTRTVYPYTVINGDAVSDERHQFELMGSWICQ